MILAGFPLPERPQSRDEANDRGFDPDSAKHDRVTPEPLDEEWSTWLDRSVVAAKHRRDPENVDDRCGTRCWTCDERMCALDGPEPRACGVTCTTCACDCTACLRARDELRADLQHRIQGEEGRRW